MGGFVGGNGDNTFFQSQQFSEQGQGQEFAQVHLSTLYLA